MVGLVREGKPVMVSDETEQTDEKTPACLIKQIAIQQPFPFSTGKKKIRTTTGWGKEAKALAMAIW